MVYKFIVALLSGRNLQLLFFSFYSLGNNVSRGSKMSQNIEFLQKRIFDKDSLAATNFKMFPGSNRDVTAEQFAEEINKSLSRLEAGDFEVLDI